MLRRDPRALWSYPVWCVAAVALLGPASALAGEYAVLASGQRMYIDRHESAGATVRLYQGAGVTELPSAIVAGFELGIEHGFAGASDIGPVEAPVTPPAAPLLAASLPAASLNDTQTGTMESPVGAAPAELDPKAMLRAAALDAGLPPEFVESVARVESAFAIDAVSPKGAIGVMQLMPQTAAELGADPHDVGQNITAGTRLLRELLIRYDGNVAKALAAYNAGAGAVDRYQGIPPYRETQLYVNKVIHAYRNAGGE